MKKVNVLLLFVALGLVLSVSSAYADREREGQGVMLVEKLQSDLGLTDEQANKVFDIVKESKKENRCRDIEVFSEIKKCRQQKHKTMNEKISSVLNKEQNEKFKQSVSDREKFGWGHGQGMHKGCKDCPCMK